MEVNLDKIIFNFSKELEEFKYFKQFNVYETVDCKDYMHTKKDNFRKACISNLQTTIPTLKVISIKIIDTIEGTSLEGQCLTGKKLIIIGKISLRVILTYFFNCKTYENSIIDVNIPFSTFIIIPKDICSTDKVNLRYLIEDVSSESLSKSKIILSVTILMQYLDEY
ncbi:DUF3794 domain-containing protein [Clostridium sp. P21]|uniref:DUF3794 domain-containing protein n=1 Tax=Clostridium muellerianum TaxID=2716538 RepID=A0A7Y0EGE8_9CLOT|nr:DUF3794 domain-containing protein [Clostridium muellerianum]NMM62652.1 DUF3794 domain-containing protein [Clostridium muellerianum]